jgi:hypothetical protein
VNEFGERLDGVLTVRSARLRGILGRPRPDAKIVRAIEA